MKIVLKYWMFSLVVSQFLMAQTGKPDLIITHTELQYITPVRNSSPDRPVRGSDNRPIPTLFITIKNIGSADFADWIYLAYTNDPYDMDHGRYSHTTALNTEMKIIQVNDSLVFQCGLSAFGYHRNKFKFLIQSLGPIRDGTPIRIIDEESIENNSYECELSNFND